MAHDNIHLTVIRHGETEWNRIGRQQGHLDSPLTERGALQARLTGRRLKGSPFDALYCSDLGRAMETAAIIGDELSLRPVPVPGLRERNLGILQGLTMEEFRNTFPGEHREFTAGDPDYIIPRGESIRQRYNRTIESMEALVQDRTGSKLLLVIHGGNLDSMFRHTLGLPLSAGRHFSLFNSSINTFSITGNSWQILTWGDISHLQGTGALDDF